MKPKNSDLIYRMIFKFQAMIVTLALFVGSAQHRNCPFITIYNKCMVSFGNGKFYAALALIYILSQCDIAEISFFCSYGADNG